jgi:hypothetical protein
MEVEGDWREEAHIRGCHEGNDIASLAALPALAAAAQGLSRARS